MSIFSVHKRQQDVVRVIASCKVHPAARAHLEQRAREKRQTVSALMRRIVEDWATRDLARRQPEGQP